MNKKTYFGLTGIVFSLVALLHLVRLIRGWAVTIGDWTAPLWISWVGLLIAGFLCLSGLKLFLARK